MKTIKMICNHLFYTPRPHTTSERSALIHPFLSLMLWGKLPVLFTILLWTTVVFQRVIIFESCVVCSTGDQSLPSAELSSTSVINRNVMKTLSHKYCADNESQE